MKVDYTKFPEGCAVSRKGVIVVCPKCGRCGEQRLSRSKRFAMHVVHVAFIGTRVSRNTKKRSTVLVIEKNGRCAVKRSEMSARPVEQAAA